jgi:hypothetical protein
VEYTRNKLEERLQGYPKSSFGVYSRKIVL